ncbi:MAG: TolC family protein [Verrucomicrobiae bacterium]|nr:TolC family protein [Verrucomicrobiae bacterium]
MKRWLFGLLLFGVASRAFAQDSAPRAQTVTLQDCIQQALEKNLELRIERYNPELSLYNLRAAYGAYDPTLGASGQHNYSKAGTTLFQGSIPLPGQETHTDTLNGSLGGLLPWGMTYELSARLSDTDGTRFDFDTNTLSSVARPFSTTRGTVGIDVTQPLLKNFWLNPTRLNISTLKNRVQWSEAALRQRIMDLITRVEFAYYDLIAAREQVKVQQQAVQLAERLLEENRKRVQVGTMAPLDEQQAEAQAAARRADLIAAQRNAAVAENALKQLLTDNFAELSAVSFEPSEPLDAPRELFDLQDSWSKALNLRPELQQARLDLERQGIQVKINRNALYPQIDLRVGGGYAGSRNEFSGVFGDIERLEQPFYYFGGQMSYPLGNRTARNQYRASKAQWDVAQLALKKLEQDIMIQVDNDIKLAQANYERVAATRKAREYAEAALAAEQKKLESGKSTTFFVLRLQSDLTAAQSDEIAALVQYRRALAQLARDEGTTLERHGITLDIK